MGITALLTDKYEYTMLEASLADGTAYKMSVFEAFTRRLPDGREYGVMAGVERVVDAINNFVFDEETLAYLSSQGLAQITIDYLRDFKFSGQVNAYPEGELFFPNSPFIQVIAPFGEAVLLETIILSILNYDCSVASAASRMVLVNDRYSLTEIGGRRTHEYAAVAAARASYIAGFIATSNIEAGRKYGIPVIGTSAHAFTLAYPTEKEAFQAQISAFGTNTTLLVDTYDIHQGILNAIEVAGPELAAIRIDSGNLKEETIKARALLDSLGASKTQIALSGDMDEITIAELDDAPADIIGVGTQVVTGSGYPTASMVYKLVEIEDTPGNWRKVEKRSSNKGSSGGFKTVTRYVDLNKSETLTVKDGIDRRTILNYTAPSKITDMYNPMGTVLNNGVRVNETTINKSRELHKEIIKLYKGDK